MPPSVDPVPDVAGEAGRRGPDVRRIGGVRKPTVIALLALAGLAFGLRS